LKRKIKFQFLGIAGLAIVTTLVLSVIIFYDLFQKQVLDDLGTYTHVLETSVNIEDMEAHGTQISEDGLRITVLQKDGTVLYDNTVAADGLENHSDRPEVQKAIEKGEGTAIRRSKTLDKNTFYYALRLDDGNVLRVAKETGSILRVLVSALPDIIVIIVVVMFLICIVLAQFLIRSLMRPIEQMATDIDQIENVKPYDELVPFVNKINQQHLDILKNAKMRQEFTANVSHELKTPLTSISGYAELIETGMASADDVNRFAGEIRKSSSRLLNLINDIIQLSQLDVVDMSVTFQDVNLYQVAESCVETLKDSAKKHDVTLKLQGAHYTVNANPKLVEELIYNLCDNAIRYNNPGGSVVVSIGRVVEGIAVSVKDTGIGISKEHQERVFERFYRVDKSRSKSTGGTGLGLAIVKHIVAQHNAKIKMSSEVGEGTEITVIF